MKKLWVFSDLHLKSMSSPLVGAFLKALQEPSESDDVVVLAGDIFDLYVGNQNYFYSQFQPIFEALKRITDCQVPVHYIQGNHDFHFEKHLQSVGVQVSSTDDCIQLQSITGKKFYIAHGDLVDTSDHAYLRLRKILRSNIIRFAVQKIPNAVIQWVAGQMARTEDQRSLQLPETFSDSKLQEFRKPYREFAEVKKQEGFDFVVLGHCHDLDTLAPFYSNMGYPPVHRQFLYYEADLEPQNDLLKRRFFTGI
jgi:UDP-2,3-diacylglucosamine hydrolase